MTETPNFTIRRATKEDAKSISWLVTATTTEQIGPHLGEGGLARLLSSMDEECTLTRLEERWLHLLALQGIELCGVVVVKPPQHLYHLFVRHDCQFTGIGKALFHAADLQVKQSTGYHIATVNASPNSIDFYRRQGFTETGDMVDANAVRFQPMHRVIDDFSLPPHRDQ